MPSKTAKQARFMRAVAHGWRPSHVKAPPMSVAREFMEADMAKKDKGLLKHPKRRGLLAARP